MYCEKITYNDVDGNEITGKFYFNLNESELIEMSFSKKGGYDQWLKRIIAERDNTKIVPLVKNIILSSYGKKSDDGTRFLKSQQISDEFYRSDAYNKLFLKLFGNTNEFVKFCNSIIPQAVRDKESNEAVEKAKKDFMDDFTPDKKEIAEDKINDAA